MIKFKKIQLIISLLVLAVTLPGLALASEGWRLISHPPTTVRVKEHFANGSYFINETGQTVSVTAHVELFEGENLLDGLKFKVWGINPSVKENAREQQSCVDQCIITLLPGGYVNAMFWSRAAEVGTVSYEWTIKDNGIVVASDPISFGIVSRK